MRENCQSGSEGGGTNPIVSPYPYLKPLEQQLQSKLNMPWISC